MIVAMALLLLLFIVLPIAEIYVIVKVGEAIGILPTLALLLLDGFLGAALARSQGAAAWRRFNEALAAGRVPAREVFDGAMVIVGGAFLLAPGFITDAIGLVLLLPPTRALMRSFILRVAKRRTRIIGVFTPGPGPRGGPRPGPRPGPNFPPPRAPQRDYDYEGDAREVRDTELPPGEPRE
jgi:UPF0716 protein FxsA